MKFECGDLERALANPSLMPEAREHLKTCAGCRQEYRLWTEISSTARELHEEWETPLLWPHIRQSLEAARPPSPARWTNWKSRWQAWAVAAALLLAAGLSFVLHRQRAPARSDGDFLTEQALVEVEKNEAAYRQSIEKLSRLAVPKLENAASTTAVNAREKLLLLDSAIADTRTNAAANRFNIRLQTTLADLYRQKQQTLEELLSRDRAN